MASAIKDTIELFGKRIDLPIIANNLYINISAIKVLGKIIVPIQVQINFIELFTGDKAARRAWIAIEKVRIACRFIIHATSSTAKVAAKH